MRMLRALPTATVALLVAIGTAGAAGQGWREARAPEGGSVTSIAVGGDRTMYAGTDTGLFVSRDGRAWERSVLPGLGDASEIRTVAAASAVTAYASSLDDNYNGHLFKTTDAGVSWRAAEAGIAEDDWIYEIAVVPGTDVAYARGYDGIYRTTDGAQTWKPTAPVRDYETDADDESEPVDALVIDLASPETVYLGSRRGIYTTTDSGSHWTKTGVGFPSSAWVTALAVRPTTPRTLYAGTGTDGIFKSVDGGFTWHAARTGLPMAGKTYAPVSDLAFDPGEPETVYAATPRGSAMSTDGGASWHVQNGAAMSSLEVARSPDRLLAGSYDQGVLLSDDGGLSWRQANAGLTAVVPQAMAVDPVGSRAVYLGTAGNGLVTTRDVAATWTPALGAPASAVTAVAVAAKPHHVLYAGTFDAGVFRSNDGGKSWARAGAVSAAEIPAARRLSPEVHALVVNPRDSRVLYAATRYPYGAAVYRTRNRGESWQRVLSTDLSIESTLEALAIDPRHPATVYAGSGWFGSHMSVKSWGVFVTRDSGAHWKRVVTGMRYGKWRPGVNALAVSARTGDVYATTDVGVYRLRRGAGRWTHIAAGLPRSGKNPAWVSPIAVNPRTGVVTVGTQFGLYELKAPGSALRWSSASRLLKGRAVRTLAVSADGKRLYAAAPGRFFIAG